MRQGIYLLIVLFCFGSQIYSQNKKPNIIVILADDLGYADVGFNGSTDIPTPHIDKIADNGVKFTSGYTSYSVCAPSRAGLITGRYQQRFGFERNPRYDTTDPIMGLAQSEKTLATVLNQSGYTSGIIGKWHLGAHISNHPLNRGFDFFYGHLGGGHDYFPEDLTIEDSYSISTESESYQTWILRNHTPEETDEYLTDEFSNEAVRFIESNKDDPFFLYLSYNAPHTPLQASQEYLDRFAHLPDSKRKTYMAMVSAVDDGVGAVLSKLQELNLEENTIVFFLSDNGGPETKNHSDNGVLRGGKSDIYEGGYRVPFAMQWKGTVTPSIYNNPVSALDIFATAVEVSNTTVDTERPLDGVNLIPHVTGENPAVPHETLYLRKFDQNKFSVRHGDYKLVHYLDGSRLELYNLIDDISETTNLANVHPTIFDELEELRLAWNIELIDPVFLGILHPVETPIATTNYYLVNSNFETGDTTGWNEWNNGVTNTNTNVYKGNWSGFIAANTKGSFQQNIHLKSNTEYQVRATIKSDAANEFVKLVVKYDGSNIINQTINTTTDYVTYSANFTTGIQTETTKVSIWQSDESFSQKYIDNFEVIEVGDSDPQARFETSSFENVQTGIVLQSEYVRIPASAKLGSEIWSIVNETGSATISESGQITPISAGTVTLKVSFEDYPSIFAEQEITIAERTPKTFYIDALYGNDNNNGISAATPWETLDKVNNTNLIPEDAILLKSGQEFFGKLIPSASGESNNPITFGSYGGSERPVINGKNFKMCIDASHKEYLVFNDLILKNDAYEDDDNIETGAEEKRYGFYAHAGYSGIKRNITLNNIKAHKIYPTIATVTENTDSYKGYGLYFTSDGSGNSNYYEGITISNCEITDIGNVGISINKWIPAENPPTNKFQKNITINNNNLHHIGGSGMVFFNVQDFLIEHNIVTYTGDFSLDNRQHGRGSGFWSVRCKNGILQHNEFSHVRGPADSCGAHIDIENDNVIIQYNLSHDNAGGFAEFMGANTNCIYRYNISINDGFRVKWTNDSTIESNPEMYSPNGSKNTQEGKIIWFSDFTGFQGQTKNGAKNNKVYNNSIYIGQNPSGDAITSLIRFENDTDYNEVKNNIFYVETGSFLNFTTSGTAGTNNVFSTNLFSNGGPSNAFFKGANDLLNTNPLFVNIGGTTADDYMLQDTSPAINTGILISNNGDYDYWGNLLSLSLPTDIGAHETDTTLGLDDQNYFGVKLYPNPVIHNINIDGLTKTTNYIIYNHIGQIIQKGNTKKNINLSEFKNGMYILKINGFKPKLFLKKSP